MGISSYSVTPALNNSAPPNGAPEGMAPSAVNDTIRQIMADIAAWYFNSISARPAINVQRITSTQTLPASTVTTLILNSENQDQGANYDPVTGIFTAAVNGVYSFSAGIFIQNNASGAYTINGLYFSRANATALGVNRFDLATGIAAGGSLGAAGNPLLMAGSIMVNLNASDTLRLKADIGALGSGSGTLTMNIGSTFSGFMVNPT